MQVIFTKNNTVLSRLIRALTKEPVSHCAIRDGDYIIHSNLYGVNYCHISEFNGDIIFSVDVTQDREKLSRSIGKYKGRMYDFGALVYLGLRTACPVLPKKNLWQCSGMFLCTEWVTQVIDEKENSEITPYQLYTLLKKRAENG